MAASDALAALIDAELARPVPAGAHALAEVMRARHGDAVRAVLFYGSNLRRGDDREGILDLYVLTAGYRRAYRNPLLAFGNALLPPNVFYVETPLETHTVRGKIAVVSFDAFARGCSRTTFEAYFWARFAQPCALVWAADEAARLRVRDALAAAVVTFVENGLPLVPARFSPAELWARQLAESYRGELRSEGEDAPRQLVAAEPARYASATRLALAALPYPCTSETDGTVTVTLPDTDRRRGRAAWPWRRRLGKTLAALRLAKGALTFQGGIDYALWKIERHSGVTVDPDWRRRGPWLVAVVRVFWRLWRRGAFR